MTTIRPSRYALALVGLMAALAIAAPIAAAMEGAIAPSLPVAAATVPAPSGAVGIDRVAYRAD